MFQGSSISCLMYAYNYAAKAWQTKFSISSQTSILHAGGQSIFRFQTSKKSARNARFELTIAEATPFISACKGVGPNCQYLIRNLKFMQVVTIN